MEEITNDKLNNFLENNQLNNIESKISIIDDNNKKIDLKIKPIKINIKKYDLKFPIDGMF